MRSLLLLAGLLLCACGAQTRPTDLRTPAVPAAARQPLSDGLDALWNGDFAAANDHFNRALETAPRDPHLHFFNAWAYDLRAETGDAKQAELAEVGYRLALKFDPQHWAAAYRLGRMLWRLGRADAAQAAFMEAMQAAPDRPEPAYALAVGAYAERDPETAKWALEQLPAADAQTPRVVRSKALVHAALGDHQGATRYLESYRALTDSPAPSATRRVQAWKQAHADALAQPIAPSAPPPARPGTKRPAAAAPASAAQARQVVFDAVIISQEESASSQRGLNLLSALQMQFGAFSLGAQRSESINFTDGTRTLTENGNQSWSLSVPQVTYSLNIANASDSRNEIIARPSVVAHDGERSEVFIGSEVTYIAPGQLGGSSHAKEVGITLEVTPRFLRDGRMKVAIKTQFGSFLPTAAPGSFEQAVATVKNRTQLSAEMSFGQTLAVAAGTSTRRSTTRSGVPILRDIPILQYLFSTESEALQKANVLILLTPRRPLRRDANGNLVHGIKGSPAVEATLQRRYGDFLQPTRNTIQVMEGLRGTRIQREFRRGDLGFAAGEPLPDADDDVRSPVAKRARRFLRDVLETIYF